MNHEEMEPKMIASYQWVDCNVTDIDGRTYRLELSNQPGYFRLRASDGTSRKLTDTEVYRRWGHLIPRVADTSD